MFHTVYLALGTNLGDRTANLTEALRRLSAAVSLDQYSAIYETPPWGITDQPAFFNMAAGGKTSLSPRALLAFVKQIERDLGREPSVRNGPRLIDIDILLFDTCVLESDPLTIPHRGLHERDFVLVPLNDIAPDLIHPVRNLSVRNMLGSLASIAATPVGMPGEVSMDTACPMKTGGPSLLSRPDRRTLIMGILNVTPDSFSGDGIPGAGTAGHDWIDTAVRRGLQLIEDGADILDLGGESSRPGHVPVSESEEIARISPVIEELMRLAPEVCFSIDTVKPEVARAAVERGASMINDISGLMDPELGAVAAACGIPIILMHNRPAVRDFKVDSRTGGQDLSSGYDDLIAEIQGELMAAVSRARAVGIPENHIILDPGIGFAKNGEENLRVLNRLDEIKMGGYPLLVGPSRKSFIGNTLRLPPEDRLEGTAAAVAISIMKGARIIRVHDVREMSRVARMCDAIVQA